MDAKIKLIAATCLVVLILLIASQLLLFAPTLDSQKQNPDDRAYWLGLARNAWEYFRPGKGVNAQTGLHSAGLNCPYFADWDLGLYIQSIIDAEKLGILNASGTWGADERIEKVLTFLEGRELSSSGLPYLWYDTGTGGRYGNTTTNALDTGKLLVALQNLKDYRPSLAARIDLIVYNRTNYEQLKQSLDGTVDSIRIYDYYAAMGFAHFWPDRFTSVAESILNNIVSAPTVETYGVKLPVSKLISEALLHCVFELKPDERLLNLSRQVYLAHEARYNATGKYVAFSEGNTDLGEPTYVYEWVMYADGQTWQIKPSSFSDADVSIPPIVFLKTAVGFRAIYNTQFARNMSAYIESYLPRPISGYMDGVDENDRVVTTITDKTNGLIITAARYAVETNQGPGSSPAPSSATAGNIGNVSGPSVHAQPFITGNTAKNAASAIGKSKPHSPFGGC